MLKYKRVYKSSFLNVHFNSFKTEEVIHLRNKKLQMTKVITIGSFEYLKGWAINGFPDKVNHCVRNLRSKTLWFLLNVTVSLKTSQMSQEHSQDNCSQAITGFK